MNERPIEVAGKAIPRPLVFLAVGVPLAVAFNYLLCGVIGFGWRLLTHEGGHAIAGWIFGHPSIPNMRGWTSYYAQQKLLVILIGSVLASRAYQAQERPREVAVWAGLAAGYVVLAWSDVHELVMAWAGHLGEVLIGCAFLLRVFWRGWRQELERPLFAMLGWALIGSNLVMCWSLTTSHHARAVYRAVSIAEHNDFVVIADGLGWRLSSVATCSGLVYVGLLGVTLWGGWRSWSDPTWLARARGEPETTAPPNPD